MPVTLEKPWVKRPEYPPGEEPIRFCHWPATIELRPWHLTRTWRERRRAYWEGVIAEVVSVVCLGLAVYLLVTRCG